MGRRPARRRDLFGGAPLNASLADAATALVRLPRPGRRRRTSGRLARGPDRRRLAGTGRLLDRAPALVATVTGIVAGCGSIWWAVGHHRAGRHRNNALGVDRPGGLATATRPAPSRRRRDPSPGRLTIGLPRQDSCWPLKPRRASPSSARPAAARPRASPSPPCSSGKDRSSPRASRTTCSTPPSPTDARAWPKVWIFDPTAVTGESWRHLVTAQPPATPGAARSASPPGCARPRNPAATT